jgi:outer membrane biosynthesis protein TonB
LNCVTPAQLRNVENSVGSLQNVDGFDGLTTSQQNQFIKAWNFEAKMAKKKAPKKKAIKKKKAPAKAKKKKKAPKKKATKKKKAPAKAKKKKKAIKKKKAPAKAKKKKAPSTSWGSKVANVIASLKARGGSSLPAIKKALNAEKKQWRFINAALKNGVANGDIIKKGGKYKLGKK